MPRVLGPVCLLVLLALESPAPARGQTPPEAAGSERGSLSGRLAPVRGDEHRVVVLRVGDELVAVCGDAIEAVEGDTVTIAKQSEVRRWPVAAMGPAPWSPARIFEAARVSLQHGASVSVGHAPLTEYAARGFYTKRSAPKHVGEPWFYLLSSGVVPTAEQLRVSEVITDPLARDGDEATAGQPKGAWTRSRYDRFSLGGSVSAQVFLTTRQASPKRNYGEIELLPLENAGDTGGPPELESGLLRDLAAKFPAQSAGSTTGAEAAPASRIDVRMLVYALEKAAARGRHSGIFDVSVTYTLRDAATGELLARGDGYGLIRDNEKHRAKDLAGLAEVCVFPRSF
jgi:hypothetical protein